MQTFTPASHKDLADERLARREITPAQYDFLARRFNFAPLSGTAPVLQPVLLPDDIFATISASGPPPAPEPTSTSTGDPLADYLRDHTDPYPNLGDAEAHRTTFPTK